MPTIGLALNVIKESDLSSNLRLSWGSGFSPIQAGWILQPGHNPGLGCTPPQYPGFSLQPSSSQPTISPSARRCLQCPCPVPPQNPMTGSRWEDGVHEWSGPIPAGICHQSHTGTNVSGLLDIRSYWIILYKSRKWDKLDGGYLEWP